MKSFTETEIAWVIVGLNDLSKTYCAEAQKADGTIERGLLNLRYEQFANLSARLTQAIKNKNKRIEITY